LKLAIYEIRKIKNEKVNAKEIFPFKERIEATGDIIIPLIQRSKAGLNKFNCNEFFPRR